MVAQQIDHGDTDCTEFHLGRNFAALASITGAFARQPHLPIRYRGKLLNGHYRIDFLVENEVVVELTQGIVRLVNG